MLSTDNICHARHVPQNFSFHITILANLASSTLHDLSAYPHTHTLIYSVFQVSNFKTLREEFLYLVSSSITKSSNTKFKRNCGVNDFWLWDLNIREEPRAVFTEQLKEKDSASIFIILANCHLLKGRKTIFENIQYVEKFTRKTNSSRERCKEQWHWKCMGKLKGESSYDFK